MSVKKSFQRYSIAFLCLLIAEKKLGAVNSSFQCFFLNKNVCLSVFFSKCRRTRLVCLLLNTLKRLTALNMIKKSSFSHHFFFFLVLVARIHSYRLRRKILEIARLMLEQMIFRPINHRAKIFLLGNIPSRDGQTLESGYLMDHPLQANQTARFILSLSRFKCLKQV